MSSSKPAGNYQVDNSQPLVIPRPGLKASVSAGISSADNFGHLLMFPGCLENVSLRSVQEGVVSVFYQRFSTITLTSLLSLSGILARCRQTFHSRLSGILENQLLKLMQPASIFDAGCNPVSNLFFLYRFCVVCNRFFHVCHSSSAGTGRAMSSAMLPRAFSSDDETANFVFNPT